MAIILTETRVHRKETKETILGKGELLILIPNIRRIP